MKYPYKLLILAIFIEQAFLGDAFATPKKWSTAYSNNFNQYEIDDDEPEGLLILDGDFSVAENNGNKYLNLAGEPLENFGFLFGPRIPGNLAIQCRFLSKKKGRRMPTFSIGMGGVTGFRLKVNPAYRKLQLLREDTIITEGPFKWQSGEWLTLRLQRQYLGDGKKWRISAKVWHGKDEPDTWNILHESDAKESAGKCSAWAAPYSSSAICFDDLKILSNLLPPHQSRL
ncbi:MAG: hypothetical protein HOD72_15335 [Opitutae bacterium]|jgi:hypothetical protein|nr:hypothetical protein [Opitutae bacterium]MBT5379393.1 hypothetical protein [Opitutae bacterium]MBT5692696.1 hypothetical protein [Opitutae bacterium]MBT6463772.1 hypothetical protein [Opitutae bacterium]MBT6958400.1 hypothetical protein [Opitutae bacterium]